EDAELLLRNMHFGPKIGSQRAKPPRETDRQRLQDGFLHPLAHPANALAQQHDQLDRDLRLALEKAEKILPPQYEQFGRLARGRIRRAALSVEHRDLAEEIT